MKRSAHPADVTGLHVELIFVGPGIRQMQVLDEDILFPQFFESEPDSPVGQ